MHHTTDISHCTPFHVTDVPHYALHPISHYWRATLCITPLTSRIAPHFTLLKCHITHCTPFHITDVPHYASHHWHLALHPISRYWRATLCLTPLTSLIAPHVTLLTSRIAPHFTLLTCHKCTPGHLQITPYCHIYALHRTTTSRITPHCTAFHMLHILHHSATSDCDHTIPHRTTMIVSHNIPRHTWVHHHFYIPPLISSRITPPPPPMLQPTLYLVPHRPAFHIPCQPTLYLVPHRPTSTFHPTLCLIPHSMPQHMYQSILHHRFP